MQRKRRLPLKRAGLRSNSRRRLLRSDIHRKLLWRQRFVFLGQQQ